MEKVQNVGTKSAFTLKRCNNWKDEPKVMAYTKTLG